MYNIAEDIQFDSNVIATDLFGRQRVDDGIAPVSTDFNPVALSLMDQVTTTQTRIARDLARDCGLDENKIAIRLFCCEFSELSRAAAEHLIAVLETKTEALQFEVPLAS